VIDQLRPVPLGEICSVNPGDSALPGDAPFVPMDAARVGERYPAYSERRGTRSGARAKAGDVLFARITPCFENGKLTQVPDGWQATGGSTEFIVLRAGPNLDPGYLFYWAQEPDMRARVGSMMTGVTGRMRLSPRDLAAQEILVPELAEQRRIVDILEDHLSRLDAADELVRRSLQRLARLRQSSLSAVLDDPARRRVPLGHLITRIEAGRSFGGAAGPASLDEWGIVKVSAMTWGYFQPEENKAIPPSLANPRFEIKDGDLLVSRANTSAYVGASVLVGNVRTKLLLSDKSLRLVPRPGVSACWLQQALSSPLARSQMTARATGTKESMRNISQGSLLSLQLPVANDSEQKRDIDRLFSDAESVETLTVSLHFAARRSLAFRRALLSAAFSGRLTRRPEGRNTAGARIMEQEGLGLPLHEVS